MDEASRDNPGLPHLPPTYAFAALFLATLLEFLLPLKFLAAPFVLSFQTLSGIVLFACGLGLDLWAFRHMKAAGTNPEPFKPTTAIVREGPFRFTRNPMYLGFIVALAGVSLIFALEWGLIAVPFLWLVLDQVVVRREEAYLTRKFGPTYAALLERTRRWI